MTKIYKLLLFILLLSIGTNKLWAQIVPQIKEKWVLDTDQSSNSKQYVARESIKLQANGTTNNFSFKAVAGKSFSAKIDQTLVFPPTTNTYALPNGTITADPTQGGVVGAIPGQFNVSPSGSASYNIPIKVPAGINGMQPNVSLVYNSQAGNGIAGWGWNLSGMSIISRIGCDLYHNGKIAFTQLSNLMLDGQRLVLISSENLSGNAKYRTEIESYSDITSKTINDSLGFEVKTKNGLTMEYTIIINSLYWVLTKVTDANGNYMIYTYGENQTAGAFWLENIKYTYNQGGGITTASSEVIFQYNESRLDYNLKYVAGRQLSQTHLLTSIVTKSNDTIQSEYILSYTPFDGLHNKLASITEKGRDGIQYNPTVINWKEVDTSENSSELIIKNRNLVTSNDQNVKIIPKNEALFIDINNDGHLDIVTPTKNTTHGKYSGWDTWISTGNTYTLDQREEWNTLADSCRILSADINRDGKTDIVEIRSVKSGSSPYYILKSYIDVLLSVNGQLVRQNINYEIGGWFTFDADMQLGDFNADGNIELFISYKNKLKFSLYSFDLTNKTLTLKDIGPFNFLGNGSSTPPETDDSYPRFRSAVGIDIDGDGCLEIMAKAIGDQFTTYDTSIYKLDQAGRYCYLTGECGDFYGKDTYGDLNGDGVIDRFRYWLSETSTSNISDYFITKNFPESIQMDSPITTDEMMEGDNYVIHDFNGDGVGDILQNMQGGNSCRVLYNNGSTFVKTDLITGILGGAPSVDRLRYLDLNSDGKIEIVGFGNNKVSFSNFPSTSTTVASITNGMNENIVFDLKPISDSSVYTHGNALPEGTVSKLVLPMTVVSRVIKTAGDFNDITNYTYQGLMVHTKGKGMLGFEVFAQDNTTQNKKTVTQFGYDPTYFTVYPTQQITSTSAGVAISTTTFTNAVQELKLKGNFPIFPYVTSQTTTSGLSGVTAKVEMTDFEDGNPKTIVTTNGTGDDAIVETKTISYVQRGSWCKNKVEQMTVLKTHDSDSETRISKFDYDETTGNLTSQIQDVRDTNQVTTTYPLYDSFGNAKTISVETNGKTRTVNLTYKAGRFVETKTNSLNETTNYTWDEDAGLLKSETFRGRTTSYKYNGFGQLKETTYPDGKRNTNVLQWSGDASEKYMLYSETSGSAPVTNYYDALGREVRKESYGLNKQKVSQFTEYNPTDGTLYRVSEPTFNDSGEKWTTFGYDDYKRKNSIVKPNGETTDIDYDGATTSISSSGGNSSSSILNTAGLTKSNTVNEKQVAYTYYPSGLAKTCTPASGAVVSMQYNLQGKRTTLTDPDLGVTTDVYDGFGQLTSETDAKSIKTILTYDANGLLLSKLCDTETTSYVYDPTLKYRVNSIEIAGKNKQTMTYDGFDRVTNVTETIVDQNNETHSFNRSVAYDFFGRTAKQTYPSGYYVTNSYDEYGNLTEVKDNANRSIIKSDTQNAFGQATTLFKGSTKTTLGYDSVNHVNNFIQSITSGNNTIVDYSYGFDPNDNLEWRMDKVNQQNEVFHYDTQNRLTGSDISRIGSSTVTTNTISYNPTSGNIDAKSDLGNFAMTYGGNGKPHALATIDGKPDAISAIELSVEYTNFNKIATLNEGAKNYRLTYGVDNQRRMSVETQGPASTTKTHFYVGDYEEEVNSLGNVRKIHYLSGAIYIQNNGNDSLLYTYTDNQGSLIALTDEAGNVVERNAYDAWGARRNPYNWNEKDNRTSWIVNRGYTGHEHLDAFGIINMNGRVYDPATAMFYSPDPLIQSPEDWLNYNRYSYCMNNPLKYTDPTGYYYDSSGQWISEVYNFSYGYNQTYDPVYYDWNAGAYFNYYTGNEVSYNQVYQNYLAPNVVAGISGDNLRDGWGIYSFSYWGQTNYIYSNGDPGTATIGKGGGLNFSNPTVGGTTIGLWGNSERGGGYEGNPYAEAGGHVSEDLGLIKLGADLNVAIEGGWNSTSTFKGFLKISDWHYSRVNLSGLSKTLNVVGHVGTVLGAAATINSGIKVYNQYDKGGLSNIKAWDAADTVVGALGTTASGVATVAGIIGAACPVTWVVIGGGATIYGVVRLGMWICE